MTARTARKGNDVKVNLLIKKLKLGVIHQSKAPVYNESAPSGSVEAVLEYTSLYGIGGKGSIDMDLMIPLHTVPGRKGMKNYIYPGAKDAFCGNGQKKLDAGEY